MRLNNLQLSGQGCWFVARETSAQHQRRASALLLSFFFLFFCLVWLFSKADFECYEGVKGGKIEVFSRGFLFGCISNGAR